MNFPLTLSGDKSKLVNLSTEVLQTILDDFNFIQKNYSSDSKLAIPNTISFVCLDRRLREQRNSMEQEGAYNLAHPGGFVPHISKDRYAHNVMCDMLTEVKLIISQGGQIDRIMTMGHTYCGAVKSLDNAIFLTSRGDETDYDQKKHMSVYSDDVIKQMVNYYKDIPSLEVGLDARLRMQEKLAAVSSAINATDYLTDPIHGLAMGVTDKNIKKTIQDAKPRVYAGISNCSSEYLKLADNEIQLLIPDVGLARLSDIKDLVEQRTGNTLEKTTLTTGTGINGVLKDVSRIRSLDTGDIDKLGELYRKLETEASQKISQLRNR